jgi:hypothetical protein
MIDMVYELYPKLGQIAKDLVTGYQGTIIAISTYMEGCPRYTLQAPMKEDGTMPDAYDFDAPQIQLIGDGPMQPPTFEEPKYGFGDKVRDKIRGTEGIVYVFSYYLNGCIRVGIQPPIKEGEVEASKVSSANAGLIEVVKEKEVKPKANAIRNGGPQPAVATRSW